MRTRDTILGLVAVLASLSFPVQADAALRVFTCQPEWGWLVEQIAPEARVDVATTAFQDVHYIQARPSLISDVRRADLVFCTGAQLEVGWLPLLLRQGGNPDVHPGRDGYLEASSVVEMRGIPDTLDRAEGDLHPSGNPHIQLDPHNFIPVAEILAERLARLDPDGAETYRRNLEAFLGDWREALEAWAPRAEALAGMQIVSHHNSWRYLNYWLGLEELDTLEPKPGLPPTTSHLARLLDRMEGSDVRVIIRSAYQSARASRWLSDRTGVPNVVLPHTINAVEGADDMYAVFEQILTRLEQVAP